MLSDFRYALRTLRKSPGFALIAIISLALGIGAVSAMFSFADAMVLRPMPVPNPSHLIAVQSQLRGEAVGGMIQYFGLSYPDFVDLRDRSKSFEGLAASKSDCLRRLSARRPDGARLRWPKYCFESTQRMVHDGSKGGVDFPEET